MKMEESLDGLENELERLITLVNELKEAKESWEQKGKEIKNRVLELIGSVEDWLASRES